METQSELTGSRFQVPIKSHSLKVTKWPISDGGSKETCTASPSPAQRPGGSGVSTPTKGAKTKIVEESHEDCGGSRV